MSSIRVLVVVKSNSRHIRYRVIETLVIYLQKPDSHGGGLLKILYPELNASTSINFNEKVRYNPNW